MLHSETKRKIDNARDILVGKIPVPMSQIEQITLAMTYKFMSDIDEDNKLLGGKTFFEGDFEKYAWKNLMDKRLGAQERMNLYSEGLDSMPKNANIPELFRDIFRNAYLPFKDPQTLDRFLKQINEFSYDHSEELGNAFEYLLSTAGSQGDAGQFRTPRHIIDFLVSIVEPTKEDTILDPACGTAGFLISAYKHILNQNTSKIPGDKLSREEKEKLSKNIAGYDISHDMVRLSLVNLYLHGFADPKISEYDTLSSDDKWNDDFNCILANPPFMTPKGGIEPHSRFSIKASKSEVLFVDYIMEHLTLNGKAGIIVPEGIIFQSANAYKELRKKMIESNFLWGVVSLPSGVFQPYSGVKTSILLFDKQIAKKTDKIIFIKVENDGFDLGAQRREINKNDLPSSLEMLLDYKKSVLTPPQSPSIEGEARNEQGEFSSHKNVLLIENSKIKESGDYNLSAERYRENTSLQNSDFEMVELGEVCSFQNGYAFQSEKYSNTGYQVMRITNVQKGYIDGKDPKFYPEDEVKNLKDFVLKKDDLLISLTGNVGRVGILKDEHLPAVLNQRVAKIDIDETKISKKYLFHLMNNEKFENDCIGLSGGVAQKNLGTNSLKAYKIPLPPLEIQEQIVEELDNYQKIIDGAKQIVENYKPKIKIDESWKIYDFDKVCTLEYGSGLPKEKRIEGIFPVMGSNGISGYHNEYLINGPGIIVGRKGSAGEVVWEDRNFYPIDTTYYIKIVNLENTNLKYIYFILKSLNLSEIKGGAGIPGLNRNDVYSKYKIPLPPLEIQEQIVAKIEEEQKMVESAKGLIEVFEGKIKERIGEVWGEK